MAADTSNWLNNVAKLRNPFSPSVPSPAVAWSNSIWASRALLTLQTVALPLAFHFKPLCVCVALFWLIYRATSVLTQPLQILSNLLGLDIPSTPLLDLANLTSTSAVLHWTIPPSTSSSEGEKDKLKHKPPNLKFSVHLNGVCVSDVAIQESAVVIGGLVRGEWYVARVALVCNEFSSKSAAVRFRTKDAGGVEDVDIGGDGHETDSEGTSGQVVPSVMPYRGLRDFAPLAATTVAAPMIREASGMGNAKSRRPSPAAMLAHEPSHDVLPNHDIDLEDSADSAQQLRSRLEEVRLETEDSERLAKEEEEEELRQKDDLIRERDELKSEANDKEKASRNLKREVGALERQNTSAQGERMKQDRLLQQKRQDRQKMGDDLLRWSREAEEFKAEGERFGQEKAAQLERHAQEKEEVHARHADEISKTRAVDDQVKERTAEFKKLERAMKDSSPSNATATTPGSPVAAASPDTTTSTTTAEQPNSLVQQLQTEAEEERKWQLLRHTLQTQYSIAFNKVETAKRFHAEQMRYLESLRAERRRQQDEMSAMSSSSGTVRARNATNASRASVGMGSNISDSPRLGTFSPMALAAPPPGSPFPPGFNAGVGGGARFFNYQNGMTLSGPEATDDLTRSMTSEERERLTGGAPMSPSAGANLIPADLFAGDGESNLSSPSAHINGHAQEPVQPLPGLGMGSLPGHPGNMPSVQQYQQQQDYNNPTGPHSPGASSSRSPSVFASPQASQPNLVLGADRPPSISYPLDSDGRSLHSARSFRAASGGAAGTTGSRFGAMFGIKQRAKNLSEDGGSGSGVPLSKANSMPRAELGFSGLGGSGEGGRKRNSSLSGAGGFGGLGGAEGEGGAEGAEGPALPPGLDGTLEANAGSSGLQSGKRAFGFFGSRDRTSGWPTSFTPFGRSGRASSPTRPGSTHSTELPRPGSSTDDRGVGRWGADAWPSGVDARGSPLAFGSGGWNATGTSGAVGSRLFNSSSSTGSRHHSRRPSVQYANAGRTPEDILEDDDVDDVDALEGPNYGALLDPIGTKPSRKAIAAAAASASAGVGASGADGVDGKLNPNAKDFRSFLGMKFGAKKAGTEGTLSASTSASTNANTNGSAAESSDRSAELETSSSGIGLGAEDSSPPHSRKSRDTRSITTAEGAGSLATTDLESGRTSPSDLVRTPSYANSNPDSPVPGSGATGTPGKAERERESFMQKITRKGSSSRFSLVGFKREKGKSDFGGGSPLTPTASTPGVGFGVLGEEGLVSYEGDESVVGTSESLGSLRESTSGSTNGASVHGNGSATASARPGVRSWSSAFKIGKKKGVAPGVGGGGTGGKEKGDEGASLGGFSTASGTEDGEDEEE